MKFINIQLFKIKENKNLIFFRSSEDEEESEEEEEDSEEEVPPPKPTPKVSLLYLNFLFLDHVSYFYNNLEFSYFFYSVVIAGVLHEIIMAFLRENSDTCT